MRVIGLCQVYDAAEMIYPALLNPYPLVDEIVVSYGILSPFIKPVENDRTLDEIKRFIRAQDKDNKVKLIDAYVPPKNERISREAWEGRNKNKMLSVASKEHNDLLYVIDVDEVFDRNKLSDIFDIFRNNSKVRFIRCREKQFAYGLQWWFPSSHGRFKRYVDGAQFGHTNHFIYPSGEDIIKRPDKTLSFDESGFYHLSYSFHPLQTKSKVISFQRHSFSTWYRDVYLVWPFDPEKAYKNNKKNPRYPASGWAEGKNDKLQRLEGKLPDILKDFKDWDWIPYIKEHVEELKI